MDRRDLLRAFGAAAALSLLPRDAEAAWARLARSPGAPLRALSAKEAAQVAALADAVLPRTNSPSATDVGVVAFVDLIVADYYKDDERKQFTEGLAAIDELAQGGTTGAIGYGREAVRALIDTLEQGSRRSTTGRAWWRLKGLVLHGYFTSEKVQKEVLKVNIMPGKFDGDAPLAARAGGHSHG